MAARMTAAVSLLVVLTMLALATGTPLGAAELPPGGTFIDDDATTHEPNIEAIAADGITAGCDTYRYCPHRPVTRAQMASFLARALHLPIPIGNRFTDVSGSHSGAINAIAEAGITVGCSDDGPRYCPTQPVSREQMASLLANALHLTASGPSPFSDVSGVHATNVAAIAEADITRGCDQTGTLYCPRDSVTRAQMATFLARALGLTPITPPVRVLPVAGNPNGTAYVPPQARAEEVSSPDTVVGTGTAASCTSAAFVAAVAQGGTIVFDCGPGSVTIELAETARVFNNANPDVVIDGGGLVTLSGMGQRRIIYMNACDPALVWTTPHCNDQDHPRLTVQNLTFVDGNSQGSDPDGGGAIWARGGRLKVVNSRFFNNVCDSTGPDVGGAAIRAFDQSNDLPIYVVQSTFGGCRRPGQRLFERWGSLGDRCLLHHSELRLHPQRGHRLGCQPAAERHSRWRQRRGHLWRWQLFRIRDTGHHRRRQHRQRRRRRRLLRLQQSHRASDHHRLGPPTKSQSGL